MMQQLDSLIECALNEDCVRGDATTLACIPNDQEGIGELILKRDGVIAGLCFAPLVFQKLDSKVEWELYADEGESCKKGTKLAAFRGNVHALLGAERTALNLVQHLSGIATLTAECVAKAHGVKILDTRKTLPGFRQLQKYAVRMGGGFNHRMHLGDAILIKNNHIALVGLETALERAKKRFQRVEVEVGSYQEFQKAMALGVEAVLLDNMSAEEVRQCVELGKKKVFLEASGGITLENLETYAKTGVDGISMGALTHSARALDIAFRVKNVYTGSEKIHLEEA